MGQTSSRVQNADTRRVDGEERSDRHIDAPISDPEPPAARRSVRRGLINLVKPSSTSNTLPSSASSSRRTDVRSEGANGSGNGSLTTPAPARTRKWRNSIWGKTHRRNDSEPVVEEVPEMERVVEVDGLEKGKEREREVEAEDSTAAAAAPAVDADDRNVSTNVETQAASSAAAASVGDREAAAETSALSADTTSSTSPPSSSSHREDREMPATATTESLHLEGQAQGQEEERIRSVSSTSSAEHFMADIPHPPQPPPPTPPQQAAPTTPTEQQRARGQFPPPGTLVVVQGIVHTTDVPRASAASRSNSSSQADSQGHEEERESMPELIPIQRREPSRSSARSMLSQLIRSRSSSRPSSGIFGGERSEVVTDEVPSGGVLEGQSREVVSDDRVPSATGVAEGEVADGGICRPEEEERGVEVNVNQSEVQPSLGDVENLSVNPVDRVEGENRDVATEEGGQGDIVEGGGNAEAEEGDEQPGPPSISSNSIDVLGTLLSVAAAATAASLLTGSSEPILQSPLSPEASGGSAAASAAPTSPTPHTPTAARHPYAPVPSTGPTDMSAPARAERMRQAWATIRERLGLRSGQQPAGADAAQGQEQGQEVGQRAPQDARELMLQEMARAFNVGLGLGNGVPPPPQTAEEARRERRRERERQERAEPPPEGSFERFLVDLQADLRIALSPEEGVEGAGEERAQEEGEAQRLSGGEQREEERVPLLEPFDHPEATNDETQASSSSAPVRDAETDSLPPLRDVSDSEDDEDVFAADTDSDVFHTPMTSRPRSVLDSNTTTGGSGRIDAAGRINWWRLYRFPAIIPPGQGHRASVSGSSMAAPSVAAFDAAQGSSPSDAPSAPPLTSAPSSTPTMSSTDAPSISTIPSEVPRMHIPTGNTVIPVIVVGLQSVSGHLDMAMGEGGEEQIPPFPGHAAESDDLEGHDAFGNQNRASGDHEPRGWQSRAANAIRNLRPGRRAPSRERGAGDVALSRLPTGGPGSRTFLIYVIGGYYPPDHTIVTSGPNNFESFEALLELAEILGQVKPPTATREDIERSGLEIIKSPQLQQYEKDGKVASNCTERCLICLDEYDPEDEIRVMNCRHAFHRNCVDKWLETGRNNCPACRSKGVSETSPTQAAAEAS